MNSQAGEGLEKLVGLKITVEKIMFGNPPPEHPCVIRRELHLRDGRGHVI